MNQAETYKGYIDTFTNQRILVVGDIVLDHYVTGQVERLNPEAAAPLLHAIEEYEMTGGAGNVAKNAAMLGAKTTLVTVIGEDDAAKQMKHAAEREGYVLQALVDTTRPTIRKVRFMAKNQQMLRVDFEEIRDINAELEEKLIATIETEIEKGVDGIIISDYAKGTITENVAKTVIALGKEKNIPVAADVKVSRAPFIAGATLVSPNLKEGHEFLGLDPLENKKEPAELARMLHEKMLADVFLTLSADGVYVYAAGEDPVHIPQEHVIEEFDVSGAGDTVITIFLLSRLAGASAKEAAVIGNAAGAVVVGKIGSVGLTQAELVDMLTHKHK